MKKHNRKELMARFQDMAKRREPIIGGGAGTGISAKWEEAGGIDLIVISSLGHGGLAEYFTGSVARNVLKGATCPVLLTKS